MGEGCTVGGFNLGWKRSYGIDGFMGAGVFVLGVLEPMDLEVGLALLE